MLPKLFDIAKYVAPSLKPMSLYHQRYTFCLRDNCLSNQEDFLLELCGHFMGSDQNCYMQIMPMHTDGWSENCRLNYFGILKLKICSKSEMHMHVKAFFGQISVGRYCNNVYFHTNPNRNTECLGTLDSHNQRGQRRSENY